MNSLAKHTWFKNLIDDCQGLVIEAEFSSRWVLIVAYHAVGERIEDERENFKKAGITNISGSIAEAMNKSPRTIQRCVQFYKKYPDLDKLPEGKNVSWHQICNKYLPESTGEKRSKNMITCPFCKKEFEL